jgi:hypothetical protein
MFEIPEWENSIALTGEQNKTAFADDEKLEINFTAKSDWVALTSVSWLRLPVNSGNAGTVTLAVELDPNTNSGNRTATIVLVGFGEDHNEGTEITLTQKGVTKDNQPLTEKDLLTAHPWKHEVTVIQHLESNTSEDDRTAMTWTFIPNGTLRMSDSTDSFDMLYEISSYGSYFEIYAPDDGYENERMRYYIKNLTSKVFECETTVTDDINNSTFTMTSKFVKP